MMDDQKQGKSEVAKREEAILKFWQENRIFEKSEEKEASKGEFVFYDGPPFATGLPHYGHILAGTIKDAIPRYKTMRGFHVRRRWGWDCHGLPLENEIEKELNLKTKRDIEELGVGKFNEAARNAVLRYADDWKRIVPRLGRWVDMENDYKTMDASYTETVWWIFKTLFDKGLIYKGFKSMHLCPRCGTTLSNFEVSLNYKDIVDFAVTVKLPLGGEKDTYLLVWTTTPWTLPGNMAAAVHKDATYVKVEKENEKLIFAKDRLETLGDDVKVLEEFKGAKLVGKSYTPPFDYYKDADIKGKENAWKIYHAPYVSLEEGTGAVHLAPAFGAEDMELAQKYDIPLVHHVTREGVFAPEVKDFAGMLVKPKDTTEEPDKHQSADIEIIKNLAHRGLLFRKEKITHSYPLCWRCDTPLLNYAAESWFVKVSEIKEKILKENEKIHWVPKEVGEKRFGNWIANAPDWAISRARYWGAPLPVWKNPKTNAVHVMGSLEDIKKHVKKSGNTYFVMRHGEADSNVEGTLNADVNKPNPLTEKGKISVQEAGEKMKSEHVDLVLFSPLERTRETAHRVAKELGLPKNAVQEEPRLREVTFGVFEGKEVQGYHSYFDYAIERLTKRPEGGETWQEVKARATELLYELEQKFQGKKILLISHNGVLRMLQAGAAGLTVAQCAKSIEKNHYDVQTGEVLELSFVSLPHNADYELDFHRPYIDEIELVDEDGTKLERIPDVFDCWFESGSMPYAQQHYPFEHTDVFEPKGGLFKKSRGYPADFIAESIDQTRGWFYSLLVLGVALFGKTSYKNVITNGLVLAEDGKKMSKRLKNYPDPVELVSRLGADSMRYYLLSSSIIRGEDLNFSESGVAEVMRKNVERLHNVLLFYQLYANEHVIEKADSSHVLDRWIVARLHELIASVTEGMENYELDRATRPIADFIDDLSTWYLRRSRDRFKSEDEEDKKKALETTRYVLTELSKIIAPFMPFYAEHVYRELRGSKDPESVHLASWPEKSAIDGNVLTDMRVVRDDISKLLEMRAGAGIKVRQPLPAANVRKSHSDDFLALLKDEVNVKEVVVDTKLSSVELDTNITPELREEGVMREFLRHVQDLRKKKGLTPHDKVTLLVQTDKVGKKLLEKFEDTIKKTALLNAIELKELSGEEIKIDSYTFTVSIKQ